jgi:hypothetical protein
MDTLSLVELGDVMIDTKTKVPVGIPDAKGQLTN